MKQGFKSRQQPNNQRRLVIKLKRIDHFGQGLMAVGDVEERGGINEAFKPGVEAWEGCYVRRFR